MPRLTLQCPKPTLSAKCMMHVTHASPAKVAAHVLVPGDKFTEMSPRRFKQEMSDKMETASSIEWRASSGLPLADDLATPDAAAAVLPCRHGWVGQDSL